MSSSELEVGRNPPWSRDELIIALDLYMKHRERLPSPNDSEVTETSLLLNRLSGALGAKFKSFRNSNSVYMKLGNFRGVDPQYVSLGKKGLSRGGKADREVWEDFALNLEALSLAAAAIKSNLLSETINFDTLNMEGITEAPEGRLLTRLHVSRERSAKLVAQKKRLALDENGTISCEACNFEYGKVYGERGNGFIEVHHLAPVHQLLPGSKTRLQDLALLCANCHRIVHARKPWLTLEELRAILVKRPWTS